MPVKHDYSPGGVEPHGGWLHTAAMDKVREIRKARGLSQVELAEKAGVNQATISKVERGNMNVTLENITAIATALGVEPVQLFSLPELQARALLAISRIDPARRDAALVVLEAMARD